jgi:hypothetical protein
MGAITLGLVVWNPEKWMNESPKESFYVQDPTSCRIIVSKLCIWAPQRRHCSQLGNVVNTAYIR